MSPNSRPRNLVTLGTSCRISSGLSLSLLPRRKKLFPKNNSCVEIPCLQEPPPPENSSGGVRKLHPKNNSYVEIPRLQDPPPPPENNGGGVRKLLPKNNSCVEMSCLQEPLLENNGGGMRRLLPKNNDCMDTRWVQEPLPPLEFSGILEHTTAGTHPPQEVSIIPWLTSPNLPESAAILPPIIHCGVCSARFTLLDTDEYIRHCIGCAGGEPLIFISIPRWMGWLWGVNPFV